jgi:hypothetical protein
MMIGIGIVQSSSRDVEDPTHRRNANGLAHSDCLELGELCDILIEKICKLQHARSSLGTREFAPFSVEGVSRGLDCSIYVFRTRALNVRDNNRVVIWVSNFELLSRFGADIL